MLLEITHGEDQIPHWVIVLLLLIHGVCAAASLCLVARPTPGRGGLLLETLAA